MPLTSYYTHLLSSSVKHVGNATLEARHGEILTCTTLGPTAYTWCAVNFLVPCGTALPRRRRRGALGRSKAGRQNSTIPASWDMRHSSVPTSEKIPEVNCSGPGQRVRHCSSGPAGSKLCHLPRVALRGSCGLFCFPTPVPKFWPGPAS